MCPYRTLWFFPVQVDSRVLLQCRWLPELWPHTPSTPPGPRWWTLSPGDLQWRAAGLWTELGPAVLHTVTHRIWVPVVLPFRKRLINRRRRERLSFCHSLNVTTLYVCTVLIVEHTTHLSQRLVSLAVRRVTFAGAISGGACRVWIFLEGWLGGLVPTMFTWRIRTCKSHHNTYFNVLLQINIHLGWSNDKQCCYC